MEGELNRLLARQYGLNPDDESAYGQWLTSHQPFHWFIEFYGILKKGGFDVIIGNPPWKEYASVKKFYQVQDYVTVKSGNLYSLCIERAINLRSGHSLVSFIVQLPLASSSRMESTRHYMNSKADLLFVIPFDDRPGKLFDGLQHCRSLIFIAKGHSLQKAQLLTTRYQRWPSKTRQHLFESIEFVNVAKEMLYPDQFPKYSSEAHQSIFQKIDGTSKQKVEVVRSQRQTEHYIFYQEATQYWTKAVVGLPFYAKNGVVGAPAHGRYIYFERPDTAHIVCALLNSSLFYLYFITYSDCFHLSQTLAVNFPLTQTLCQDKKLVELCKQLMLALRDNAERKSISTRTGDEIVYDEYYASKSKLLIDEIDRIVGQHYGFTAEELDFIINYDIKYRLGDDLFDDEEEVKG